jgi:F0F1-type ATP synthase membrane subunit b/b'
VEGNVMAAPNIGHSVIRIVNVFVVVILILILLNLLGQPISNAIPSAAQNVRDMLAALRKGIKDLVPINWNNYFYRHH